MDTLWSQFICRHRIAHVSASVRAESDRRPKPPWKQPPHILAIDLASELRPSLHHALKALPRCPARWSDWAEDFVQSVLYRYFQCFANTPQHGIVVVAFDDPALLMYPRPEPSTTAMPITVDIAATLTLEEVPFPSSHTAVDEALSTAAMHWRIRHLVTATLLNELTASAAETRNATWILAQVVLVDDLSAVDDEVCRAEWVRTQYLFNVAVEGGRVVSKEHVARDWCESHVACLRAILDVIMARRLEPRVWVHTSSVLGLTAFLYAAGMTDLRMQLWVLYGARWHWDAHGFYKAVSQALRVNTELLLVMALATRDTVPPGIVWEAARSLTQANLRVGRRDCFISHKRWGHSVWRAHFPERYIHIEEYNERTGQVEQSQVCAPLRTFLRVQDEVAIVMGVQWAIEIFMQYSVGLRIVVFGGTVNLHSDETLQQYACKLRPRTAHDRVHRALVWMNSLDTLQRYLGSMRWPGKNTGWSELHIAPEDSNAANIAFLTNTRWCRVLPPTLPLYLRSAQFMDFTAQRFVRRVEAPVDSFLCPLNIYS